MGSNALYGIDGAQGYTPHLGMVTCFRNAADWALMGELYNPKVQLLNLGLTTYSFHPEAMTWSDAEATCQAQALQIQAQRTGSMPFRGGLHAVGHLASAASNDDYEILLTLMAQQPPVFTSPGYGVLSDFYGEETVIKVNVTSLPNPA